jgi:signal transduction histidine kinase/ligand-binding sensor domain-containing protein
LKALPFITIFFIVLLSLPQSSTSQVYSRAKNLSVKDGLSDNNVTSFFKDSKGFVWIGTSNGLNRYDGHSFKIYKPAAGNSISNEVINDIAEDSKGRIWVATMEGLNYYDPAKDQWECMRHNPASRETGLPNDIVWDIDIDKSDVISIASDVFAFCTYNIHTKKFILYDWPAFARNHPSINTTRYRSIQKFTRKSETEYWLATTRGLVSLNTQTGKFEFISGGYNENIKDIKADDKTGKVFLSADKGKFFCYSQSAKKFTIEKIIAEPFPSVQYEWPGNDEIWMASVNGLIKINDQRTGWRLQPGLQQLSASLLPGSVNVVYTDRNGIKWIGTSNGMSVFDHSGSSSYFLPLLPKADATGMNNISGVYFDEESQCYFVCAIEPSSVFIINKKTGVVQNISSDTKGKQFVFCTAIRKDNDNNIWLLTANAVYRYNRANNSFTEFPTPQDGSEAVFRDMKRDKKGNYWFASFNKAILFYDVAQKKFIALNDSISPKMTTATGIAFTDSDNMLVSSFGTGLFRFHFPSAKATGFFDDAGNQKYARLLMANSMYMDRQENVWVATYAGGVFKYNPGKSYNDAFTQYDMRTGLPSNSILSVCSGSDSVLWVLTAQGLAAMNTNGTFSHTVSSEETFGFHSFASDSRYPHDIYYDTTTNELLTGVGGGLLIYHSRKKASLQFPIAITRVQTNDKLITTSDSASYEPFRLPFRSNAVSFSFAGLYYGSANITYEYWLEGYDKNWIKDEKKFEAAYQNLPPGKYIFQVRAKDAEGNITGEATALSFRIIPPFWRSIWFVGLIVLAVVATVWWFIRSLQEKLAMERIVNSFATSLYGQNTTEDIFWDVAKNCIEKLGFVDCVIYQRDELKNVLIQKAAYGPKNPYRREIVNILELPVGKGIVGSVAESGKSIIIKNTSKDERYVVDDEKRLSEITVPVKVDGKVYAVIDSEHPQKSFYKSFHLRVLKKIAAICAERISKHLTEERLRAKIARDLHDEMGSTLTSINIISKVAMEVKQDEEKIKEYFQKIKDHSGRMMESMSDMVWAINPINDSFEKVILKIKEFTAEMLEPARINYYFKTVGPLEEIQLNPEQRKDVYLIFKEAVNNIVKYSGATEVNIVFNFSDKILKMQITDNGNGFDTAIVSSGNGLKNMQSRSREIGATIKIDSIKGAGSSISMLLPIT